MSTGDGRFDDVDEIRLALPALYSYGRVARLAVTGLASRNGFSYDDVEDLRIAIGEVFGLLSAPEGDQHRLVFACRLGSDALEVVTSRQPAAPLGEVGDLSSQILEAVVDEVGVDHDAGVVRIVKLVRG